MKGAPPVSGDRCESLLSTVAGVASGWAPVDREELRDELVPLVVALQYRGSASSAAAGLLSGLLRSPLRDVRLRGLAALQHVLIGTGEPGLAVLASLDLDSDHRLRDHEPRLIGASLAGAPGEMVADALGAALQRPSPARRKEALAGLGLALRGTAWQPAIGLIDGVRRPGNDMTVFLARLEALGSVFEARAAGETLETLMQFRAAREWEPLIDAGYDPVSPIAQAAELGPPLERVRREVIDPLLRCAGNSRRRALRRLVGLRAHVTACRASGGVPLDPAWELLADPMRKVRRAALWSLPHACEHATVSECLRLTAELGHRSSAGPWQRACAALCAGALGTATPSSPPMPWLTSPPHSRREESRPYGTPSPLAERGYGPEPVEGPGGEVAPTRADLPMTQRVPALVAGAEILAACRSRAGSADEELNGLAVSLLESPETAGFAALGLGLLYRGTQEGDACDALLRWSARRRSARLRAAAAVAVGLVLRGADPGNAITRLTPALIDKGPLVRRAGALGLAAAVFPEAGVRSMLDSGCLGPLPVIGLSYVP